MKCPRPSERHRPVLVAVLALRPGGAVPRLESRAVRRIGPRASLAFRVERVSDPEKTSGNRLPNAILTCLQNVKRGKYNGVNEPHLGLIGLVFGSKPLIFNC